MPGLTIPIVSALRINGQYFVYLAEPAGQGLVARQRPVQVGDVQGNDYVVKSGLKAGDRLIVSGVQKIADGAPVKPEYCSSTPSSAGRSWPPSARWSSSWPA